MHPVTAGMGRILPLRKELCYLAQRYKAARGDYYRWEYSKPNPEKDIRRQELESELPIQATNAISGAVRKFGGSTYKLLRYVYQTQPMLNAKPGDLLRFEKDPIPETTPLKESKSFSKRK